MDRLIDIVYNSKRNVSVYVNTVMCFDGHIETMVFSMIGKQVDYADMLDSNVYDSAENAQKGHKEMIEKWEKF